MSLSVSKYWVMSSSSITSRLFTSETSLCTCQWDRGWGEGQELCGVRRGESHHRRQRQRLVYAAVQVLGCRTDWTGIKLGCYIPSQTTHLEGLHALTQARNDGLPCKESVEATGLTAGTDKPVSSTPAAVATQCHAGVQWRHC